MVSLPPLAHLIAAIMAAISVVGSWQVTERGADFWLIRNSATVWLQGGDPYLSHDRPNLNHPVSVLLGVPFSIGSPGTGLLLWTLTSLACAVGCSALIGKMAKLATLDVIILMLATQGAFIALSMGQVSFLLAPLMTAAWWAARHKHSVLEGAMLGVLALLKPFYLIFLPYLLWRRDSRAVLTCVLSLAAGTLAGALIVGTTAFGHWIDGLSSVSWTRHLFNGSLWGVAARLFDAAPAVDYSVAWTPVLVSLTAKRLFIIGALLLSGLLTARLVKGDTDTSYAAMNLASLLISPLGWIYYLPIATGPLLAALSKRGFPAWWLLAPVLWFPEPLIDGSRFGVWATALVAFWPFAMVALPMIVMAVSPPTHVLPEAQRSIAGSAQ